MFIWVVYVPTIVEYDSAMDELRRYKQELAEWVGKDEPDNLAQSKFGKERCRKLNNKPMESWNNWMWKLRTMSILCLVIGYIEKLGKK